MEIEQENRNLKKKLVAEQRKTSKLEKTLGFRRSLDSQKMGWWGRLMTSTD